jgi:hypothetical protein
MDSRALEPDTAYTLHFLQLLDERVVRVTHIEAPDDDHAIKAAATWKWSGAVEVWQGERRVVRFDPDGGPMAA